MAGRLPHSKASGKRSLRRGPQGVLGSPLRLRGLWPGSWVGVLGRGPAGGWPVWHGSTWSARGKHRLGIHL